MSDSIVRLRVESEEFDNKIKQAAEALSLLAQKAHESGAILNVLEDENRDYITSIGQMSTLARGARASLAELKGAYLDLSVVYRQLSDEEKSAEFGQELNKQLDVLKGRIQEGDNELERITQDLGSAGEEGDALATILDTVAGKFGLSAKLLVGFSSVAGSASAAMKITKDAFFASEQNIDDFGRTVSAAKSSYEALLVSMNTGDVGGFIGKMNQVMAVASKAYTEVDKLGTQRAINNARVEGQRVENERNRAMLQTGRYIAPSDGSTPEMAEGTLLNDTQKRTIEAKLQEGMATLNSIVREEIVQMNVAITSLYEQQAAELGMSKEVFMEGTASMDKFQEMLAGAAKYRAYEAEHTTTTTMYSPTAGAITTTQRDKTDNPYEEFKSWSVFKDDGELFRQINEFISERSELQRTNIAMTREAYQSINAVEGISPRAEDKNRGATSGGVKAVDAVALGSIEALKMQLKELQELQEKVTNTEDWKRYEDQIKAVGEEIERIKSGGTVSLGSVGQFRSQLEQQMQSAEVGSETQGSIGEQLKNVKIFESLMQTMAKSGASFKNATSEAFEGLKAEQVENLNKQLKELYSLQQQEAPGTESWAYQKEQIKSVEGEIERVNSITTSDIQFDSQGLWEKIAGGEEVGVEVWTQALKAVNDALQEEGVGPVKIDFKTGNVTKDKGEDDGGGKDDKKEKDTLGDTKQLLSGLNSVSSGLQQMGIALPEEVNSMLGIVNGFIQVVEGIGMIMQMISGTALSANTAALVANTTALAMNTTVGSIPFFKGGGIVQRFASGGIPRAATGYVVPGHDYSDMTPIMVSSGELILNKAQQGNLASQFNSAGGEMRLTSRVRGTDLWMIMERTKRDWNR